MPISRILERLRLREAVEAVNSANYYLLSSNAEKGEDAEGSASDVDPGRRSTEADASKKRRIGWRWLRIFLVLVPSFLQGSATSAEPKKLRPTAWLGEQTY